MTCENGNPFHDGTGSDFGCKVKGITFNPYAMPSRLNFKNPPKKPNPAWERGVPTDSRGMPFLGADGKPIGIKKYTEEKHSIEEKRRKNHHLSTESRP